MIAVTVRLHAHLERYAGSPDGTVTLKVADGSTIHDVVERLSIGPREAGLFEVNGSLVDERTARSTTLRDQDRLDIYAMMMGG